MAEYNEVYQRAVYYDIVFRRDVSREINFVQDVYRRINGREAASMMDLACGPGYHARAFAARGLRAVGLDLRGEMLAFAREQAEAEGVLVEWVEADMRTVKLAAPVDVVLAAFDGMDALQHNDDLIAHYRCMADNLTPGGLYIAEMTHIADCFYGNYGRFYYDGERDGITVEYIWATNNPQFDVVTGIAEVEIILRVNDNGKITEVVDRATERVLSPQEIMLLTELSGGLRVIGWYGDYRLTQRLDWSAASRRMICVMQRR